MVLLMLVESSFAINDTSSDSEAIIIILLVLAVFVDIASNLVHILVKKRDGALSSLDF